MNAIPVLKRAWARYRDHQRRERQRHQQLRDLATMTSRDLADIGVSRATLEFELNRPTPWA